MDLNFDPAKLSGNLHRNIANQLTLSAEMKHARDKVISDAAENLNEINEKVAMIDQGLVTERKERKAEDEKNMKYTKRMDLINLAIAEPHNTRQMICAVDIAFTSILVFDGI